MNKIILVGTFNSDNATLSFERGFQKLNIKVIRFPYREIASVYGMKKRDDKLINLCKKHTSDFVLFLKANRIDIRVIKECNKVCPTFLWYMDALNAFNKELRDKIKHCTCTGIALYEVYEIAKHIGENVYFLNDGFDPEWDKPIIGIRQSIDVGFIGNLYGERKEYHKKIGFLHRTGYYCEQLAKTTAETKINLVFTNSGIWAHNGPSARLYKILAHRGFVLLENCPYLGKYGFTVGKDFDVFTNAKELNKKIDYYLKHPHKRNEIADNGYKTVQKFSRYCLVEKIVKIMEK
jgi:hypothetical protein